MVTFEHRSQQRIGSATTRAVTKCHTSDDITFPGFLTFQKSGFSCLFGLRSHDSVDIDAPFKGKMRLTLVSLSIEFVYWSLMTTQDENDQNCDTIQKFNMCVIHRKRI